mmetsp:Transcript_8528/g.14382  ORF Transcript_8528/g.14382 Transcript_8528/m.14382 type:complete len:127 (+) Transcript_8528:908-1288(+)
MRDGSKGMEYIAEMMRRFEYRHPVHMKLYGIDNEKRLTGIHETSSYKDFSYGAGNRAASFRIPTSTMKANGKGYIEDRRPASNIDPYCVSSIVYDTGCLENSRAAPLVDHYMKWTKYMESINVQKA